MDTLMLSAAGLITVAAITPGPNNLVVMRAAAQAGFVAAMPAVGGILAGGLVMLLLAMAGGGAVFAAEPRLIAVIAIAGAAYLCWLGASLVIGSAGAQGTDRATSSQALPTGAGALFGFQFLNPKSWVMVLTVTAAMGADGSRVLLPLLLLFTVIPALCLTLWSALGVWISNRLSRPHSRAWLDRVMGLLLIASALLLVFAAYQKEFHP
jgi:threonine/homoserine/homoserine lactone efflux protein